MMVPVLIIMLIYDVPRWCRKKSAHTP
jgi:hypothetical protein